MDTGLDGAAGANGAFTRARSALSSTLAARAPELLAVGGVAVALLTQFLITDLSGTVSDPGYWFMLAVALFAASGFVLWCRERVGESTVGGSELTLPGRWEVALVASVFVLAAFFRFWRFFSFPPGLWYDEAINASDAVSLIDRDHTRIWFDTVFGRSTLYLYLLAGSFKLFGFTLFAIRVVPAVAGLLAVVAFYPLARRLVGPAPAIVATALFAVSRWAVTFSRISWEASLQPLLEIVAVWGFVYGLDSRKPWAFALGGATLAGGLYTYIAFRIVPFFIAFLFLYVLVTQWRLLRRNVIGIAVYAVTFLVVVAPLANFALHNQDRFLERQRQVNVFKEIDERDSNEPLKTNIARSFKMLNVRGDHNGRHNLPGAPQVDEVTGALVVLGLAVSVWSFRNWRRGSVAPWLLLSLIPGALTITLENPSAIRGIGALPPIFLLVGLAVAGLERPLAMTRGGTIAFGVIASTLVAGSVAINYYDIFERQASDQTVYEGFTPEYTQVGEAVASHADSTRAIVSRQFHSHFAVTVLNHDHAYESYSVPDHLVFPPEHEDVYMIMDSLQFGLLPLLKSLYPAMQQSDYVDPYGRVYFTRLTIPRQDTHDLHLLPLSWSTGTGFDQTEEARVDRLWTPSELEGGTVAATWEGYFWVGHPFSTPLTVKAPGAVFVEFDGEELQLDDEGRSPVIELRMGEHRVRISALITAPGKVDATFQDESGNTVLLGDALYARSLGDRGFQVIYRQGGDFAGAVSAQGRVPFTVPVPALPSSQAIEYRGLFNAPGEGTYGFALEGTSSAQLFVDDKLVVDNGGGHPYRRVEGEVELTGGEHTVSIQYTTVLEPNWLASYRLPEAEWTEISPDFVRPPAGEYRPPALVTLEVEPEWLVPRTVDGVETPQGVALLPDGSIAVGGKDAIAIFDGEGNIARVLRPDGVRAIVDLAATDDGQIVALDAGLLGLVTVDPANGAVTGRVEGAFASAAGLDVSRGVAYVASPLAGFLYRVPLAGGDVTQLAIAEPTAPVRAIQPSDIAVAEDGAIYVADFEKKAIVRSTDGGLTATKFPGAGGTGDQLPHLATYGELILITDPTTERIVIFDRAGRQRGVYTFPRKTGGTRPIGIVVTPDGLVYTADRTGYLYRLKINIPDETQAELDALP